MGTEHIAKAGFHLSVQEVVVRVFEVQVLSATQRQRIAYQQFLKTTHLHPMSSYNPPQVVYHPFVTPKCNFVSTTKGWENYR